MPPHHSHNVFLRVKGIDHAYDEPKGPGAPWSVYSPQAIIAIVYEHARCQSCHQPRDLINHFCALCRDAGANEAQCMRPDQLQAKRGSRV